jgi:hypothetical protein
MLKPFEREQIRADMEKGQMSTDFDPVDWGVAFDDWAVGQHAASLGYLDFDFDESALADYLGRPLLPAGWTIAHEAAKRGLLPDDFDQWGLVTSQDITVLDVALQAEFPPSPGFAPRTREEINDLKQNWKDDPYWDIEFSDGFEAHSAELRAFRLAVEAKWRTMGEMTASTLAATIGVSDNPALAKHLQNLHSRIYVLEEKVAHLIQIVTEDALPRKSHGPKF